MPTKILIRWVLPTNSIFQKSNISPIVQNIEGFCTMKTLVKWTISDYHKMIQSDILTGRNCELINGEIIDRNESRITSTL